MSTNLTRRRLDAICEALAARLAGIIDDEQAPLTRKDYEAALDWASAQRDKREKPRPTPGTKERK